mmetsp:Transcript_5979/g.12309  ORF Transcript_5979/g.12309 Transcript_5979/m.12309 type:complete len:373 (+) Transcript_5979:112-1230(+)
MRCLALFVGMCFAVTASCFAFTQYRVEFHAPRTMHVQERAMVSRALDYCESTNATIEDERDFLKSRMPAPIDASMSKYQVEFRELLEGILYTPKELQTVLNPRMKAILEGIAASYYEHDVYRAFEVLYEDYVPLRVAGRLVYRELRKVMDESRLDQQAQIDSVMKYTGMELSDVEECWATYSQIASDRSVSLVDLEEYLGPQTLKLVLDSSSNSESETAEAISFDRLVIGLHNLNLRYDSAEDRSNSTMIFDASNGNILKQALQSSDALDRVHSHHVLSPKRQKFNQRYDDMLIQFAKWKPLIPSGEGRRLDILRGCFTGSENPAVVEALRIIYVDYAALRLSGDWIFKVVSALMGPLVRRNERRQKATLKP